MAKERKAVSKETTKETSTKDKTVEVATEQDIKENKLLAVLCYIGILVVIPMLMKPESKFLKFHSRQGLILAIAWFVALPFYYVMGLGFLIQLAIIVFSIIGIINVSEGEMKKLPIIGDLAEKFKF